MSVLSSDPETTRRPSGNTATLKTYNEGTSSQKYGGHCAPHVTVVPFHSVHDFAHIYIRNPGLGLRRRQIITKVQWTPQRTCPECPFSVATHSPVDTSHTLSVLSRDADTRRRPPGEMATLLTYDEARSSQKYGGRRNALHASALPASPRIRRSRRSTP